MRVLILRPEAEARRVAEMLKTRGHDSILAPIIRIDPTGTALPGSGFDFIVATSANALCAVSGTLPSSLLSLPLYGVGTQVEAAAQKAGFRSIRSTALTVADLTRQIIREQHFGACALYLAGHPRKPMLEIDLKDAGLKVTTIETYRARPVAELPVPVTDALKKGVDVVLHFSRASAISALEAFVETKTLDDVAKARHLCLSGDIASAFVSRLDWRIEIASKPTLESLLDLMDHPLDLA